jgi:hypothetical protein
MEFSLRLVKERSVGSVGALVNVHTCMVSLLIKCSDHASCETFEKLRLQGIELRLFAELATGQ